jgi:hypothetical protein
MTTTQPHTARPPEPYPVRVDAALDAPLSRWLWLVKWLLVLPHLVVLAFLWVAFALVTVIAFFAILLTARYPRPLFDFNVGVLRWTWRVQYYSYSALGTDRYPPFTLAEVPDYPAHLTVEYPERLSRGLVLVKWWLLAIPHYLVLAVFVGGGAYYVGHASDQGGAWAGGSLVGLLVLVAAVVLLVTGRYPQPVYDFVLGMDRWSLRVAGYVGLMTDRYPPFRLDLGGADPGWLGAPPPSPPPVPGSSPVPGGGPEPGYPVSSPTGYPPASPGGPAPAGYGPAGYPPAGYGPAGYAAPPVRPHSWTAGRVVALVVGALLVLTSIGVLTGGGAALWADRTQRVDGYLTSGSEHLTTAGHALQSGSVAIDTGGDAWISEQLLGSARLQVTPVDPAVDVFVGVASTPDVQAWLSGAAYGRVEDLGGPDGGRATVTERAGGDLRSAPAAAGIWRATATGTGRQVLDWRAADGDWTVVVARADGAAGLDVTARAGVTVPALGWVAAGLLAAGVLLLALGALLVVFAVRRSAAAGSSLPPVPTWPAGPPPVVPEPRPGEQPADRPAPTAADPRAGSGT